MKQSSIEWLEDNLKSLISEDGAIYDFKRKVVELFDQAKELHKQEIIEAHCDWNRIVDKLPSRSADEYYKNTYEKEN